MTVDEVLASVRADTADELSEEVHMLAVEVERLRAELADAPKRERERLAAWFETHADDLRGFTDGNLSVEFVAFLLRLAGE